MRRTHVKPQSRLVSYFLAFLLITVESGALVHELHHQMQKPDTPCAQCLFAKHLGKMPVTVSCVPVVCAPETHLLPVSLPAPRRQKLRLYAVRAPPLRFEI